MRNASCIIIANNQEMFDQMSRNASCKFRSTGSSSTSNSEEKRKKAARAAKAKKTKVDKVAQSPLDTHETG